MIWNTLWNPLKRVTVKFHPLWSTDMGLLVLFVLSTTFLLFGKPVKYWPNLMEEDGSCLPHVILKVNVDEAVGSGLQPGESRSESHQGVHLYAMQ